MRIVLVIIVLLVSIVSLVTVLVLVIDKKEETAASLLVGSEGNEQPSYSPSTSSTTGSQQNEEEETDENTEPPSPSPFQDEENAENEADSMIDDQISSPLDKEEIEDLLFIREEEKLARDVYLTMGQLYGTETSTFSRIANSEQMHMNRMLSMIELYGLADPIVDESDIGTFKNTALQDLYDALIANGTSSLVNALHVGALIEEVDIDDLQHAIDESDEGTLDSSYDNLMNGSFNHLRAFVSAIENLGVEYRAQLLSQEEVDEILSSGSGMGMGHGN